MSDTRKIIVQDVRVPKETLLGEEGRGFVYLMQDLPQRNAGQLVVNQRNPGRLPPIFLAK